MPKSDFIPRTDSDFLVWHDQFKTAVLAQAATFGLVAADTTPITNDNTDIHAKVTSVNSTSAIATQAVADKNTSRANANKQRPTLLRTGMSAPRAVTVFKYVLHLTALGLAIIS